MIYIYLSIIVVFIIFLVCLLFYIQFNNIDNFEIKIEEIRKNIILCQEKEIKILTNIFKDFKTNYEKKGIPTMAKIKNKSLDIFETDEELYNCNKSLKEYLEDNAIMSYASSSELHSSLIESNCLKQFYNDTAIEYNNIISSFKYLIIKLIKKKQKLQLFNIKKEVEFEILKEKQ